jgi:uncharacterized protein YbjT (DUF2867 family)
MKVVVFGSSGQTGLQLIKQLIEAGYEVTAFARTPLKLKEFENKIRIIKGDARDGVSVLKAVTGQDAVLHVLSEKITEKSDIQTVFADNLVSAMKKSDVKRLIVLSARGSGDSHDKVPAFFKPVLATLLKNVFIDKKQAEEIIIDSPLDYTLVRPFILTNGPLKKGVVAMLVPKDQKWRISRADVADFMVSQLNSQSWVRQAPLIGYSK